MAKNEPIPAADMMFGHVVLSGTTNSADNPWGGGFASLHVKYPNQKGRVLQNTARGFYVTGENVTLPLQDDDGEFLFERHPENNREQEDTLEHYCNLVIEHGSKIGARSEIIVIPSHIA